MMFVLEPNAPPPSLPEGMAGVAGFERGGWILPLQCGMLSWAEMAMVMVAMIVVVMIIGGHGGN